MYVLYHVELCASRCDMRGRVPDGRRSLDDRTQRSRYRSLRYRACTTLDDRSTKMDGMWRNVEWSLSRSISIDSRSWSATAATVRLRPRIRVLGISEYQQSAMRVPPKSHALRSSWRTYSGTQCDGRGERPRSYILRAARVVDITQARRGTLARRGRSRATTACPPQACPIAPSSSWTRRVSRSEASRITGWLVLSAITSD